MAAAPGDPFAAAVLGALTGRDLSWYARGVWLVEGRQWRESDVLAVARAALRSGADLRGPAG